MCNTDHVKEGNAHIGIASTAALRGKREGAMAEERQQPLWKTADQKAEKRGPHHTVYTHPALMTCGHQRRSAMSPQMVVLGGL